GRRAAPRDCPEHQAADGDRHLPWSAPPSWVARPRPTHPDERAHPAWSAQDRRRAQEGRGEEVNMPKKKVVRTRRREKKHVNVGQTHIQSTFNNTVVSLTDAQGNVLAWGSAGSQGIKCSQKRTPFAAQSTPETTQTRATYHGI